MEKKYLIAFSFVILCTLGGCSKQKQIASAHMSSIFLNIVTIEHDSITTTLVNGQSGLSKDDELILHFTDPEELSKGLRELTLTKGDKIRVLYFNIQVVDNKNVIEIPNFHSRVGLANME